MERSFIVANTVQEAVVLKKEHGGKAIYLAGGTEVNRLNASIHQEFTTYISLANLPKDTPSLAKITQEAEALQVGALVTLQELVDNKATPHTVVELITESLSRPVRTVATVGGNIATKRKDSYLAPILIALDATLMVANSQSGNQESLSVESYLLEGRRDLILGVTIPLGSANKGPQVVAKRVTETTRSVPVCTVAVSTLPRVVLFGETNNPIRLTRVEEALTGEKAISQELVQEEISQEMGGSSPYREYVAGVTVMELLKGIKGEA